MRELGLAVTIDAVGNIVGVRGGRDDLREDLRDDLREDLRDHLAPVMLGSHVDTVGTGGANLD
jgi:beta-ureidopropionase / N-carbamoyl-L-amino-acid hydrolase